MKHTAISRVITLVLLLIAALVPDLPYGFYQLIKIFICCTMVHLAYQTFKTIYFKIITWGSLLVALVFNPLLPPYFSKDQWVFLDLISALFLAVTFLPKYKNHL